jgi:hypothetical protein
MHYKYNVVFYVIKDKNFSMYLEDITVNQNGTINFIMSPITDNILKFDYPKNANQWINDNLPNPDQWIIEPIRI